MPILPPETSELIAALARTPHLAGAQIAGLSDDAARQRKTDDYFSAIETICHLRDIEVEGYTVRIERILNEEQPVLPDIDGGRLAVEREYNRQSVQEALAAFAEARERNIGRLRSLEPEQLDRAGTLEGVGSVTLEKLLLLMQEHDASHLDELSSLSGSSQSELTS
jgi:hypothetical protein